MSDLIAALQRWYTSQCNDVWEHSYGVEIVNVDNPGWRVKINGATAKRPTNINIERDDEDWIRVSATETEFIGYGGPSNLQEILELGMDWLQ
ncbi:immunity 53 family protein [Burkholderia cenocepacia]|uniref:Imm53 family immunity protein n=1 Tax=Burkholderia TaxID=32008 RepID=UPI0015882AC6|nr:MULTISPECIES: Imm53 family immunity protein [Burkholderia]MBR8211277.1 immunity 53 family protein [Burkholderia cenocepacia]